MDEIDALCGNSTTTLQKQLLNISVKKWHLDKAGEEVEVEN